MMLGLQNLEFNLLRDRIYTKYVKAFLCCKLKGRKHSRKKILLIKYNQSDRHDRQDGPGHFIISNQKFFINSVLGRL